MMKSAMTSDIFNIINSRTTTVFHKYSGALLDSKTLVTVILEVVFQILNLNPSQHKTLIFLLTGILLTTNFNNK